MSRMRQPIFCLAAVAVAAWAQAQPVEPVPVKSHVISTNLLPPMPIQQSPVNLFRQLLMMSPSERNLSLAGRTPESRARIMVKIHEYLALEPDERELRLRATELRWYLTPLLRTPPADRDPQLVMVPPELRELAKARLTQWDLLPPSLQQEFLANDKTLLSFAQPAPAFTNSQSDKIAGQLDRFFELTAAEKRRILGTLSGTERAQMEKTLKRFDQLPPPQRVRCIRNYAKFAGMSAAERAEFLKSAESWSKMSPQERQAWRDLVSQVPLWPPMPPSIMPPMPPLPQKISRAGMATN
jgi:hypothetical protein